MKVKMNIKSIIFMAAIALASLLFINISFAANTGKIIVETAKLREQPNTDSKVLELASLGEEVEILEQAEQWYKVKYKRITGYIRNDLIQVDNKEENKTEDNSTKPTETTPNTTEENMAEQNNTVETNIEPVEEKSIQKGKYKLSENIKLKIIPLISSIELDEIGKDTEVEVTEILNDWTKIKTQDGKEGWIRAEKLSIIQENVQNNTPTVPDKATTTDSKDQDTSAMNTANITNSAKTMYVNSQTINMREKADKTSKAITQLSINTEVKVFSTENGWSYVEVKGKKGYIADNLLSSTKQETTRSSTTTRTNTTQVQSSKETPKTNTQSTVNTSAGTQSGTGSSVVSYAKQFLGCKYVYGGTTTKGFDCSGFTQYVYKNFGVSLNRTAAAQYSNGTSVTNLQPGDLVMFGKSGINHVGIYIGGNTFIHAANSKQGVRTDTLSSGYYKKNYVGARRVL